MKPASEINLQPIEFQGDIRWDLVQRIIDSPSLVGSARLRDFLLHVTACAIRQTPEDATEQQIGIQVFQRSPGFNSSEDSIVRSQARLLRLKLSSYFNAEGANEPLIIEIPKGHYLPVFLPARRTEPATEALTTGFVSTAMPTVQVADLQPTFLDNENGFHRNPRQYGWLAATILVLLLCFSLV